MQWLVHGVLAQAVSDALVRHHHTAHAPAEAELPENPPPADVLAAAWRRQWDLITNDPAVMTSAIETRHPFKRSLVYLQLDDDGGQTADAIDRLFARYKRLVPGRLYTVTANRVKIRQLPQRRDRLKDSQTP